MLLDLLRAAMRTAHLLAGAAWVGGSLMYLLVVGPSLRLAKAPPEVGRQVARLFRRLVNLCIGVLIVTGVFLAFDRLSSVEAGAAYIAVLLVKIALAVTMFLLALYQAQEARRRPDRRGRLWRVAPRLILWLGIATFALGATLVQVYEASLVAGH